MELISRYIYAVTRRLPEKQRADIEQELRGLIEDMLEVRLEQGETKEEAADAVLRELGEPRALAARYGGGTRYLIGPELFPIYLSILRISAAATAIALSVSFFIRFLTSPALIDELFADFGMSLLGGAFQIFTWVTLTFAFLEYAVAKEGKPLRQGKGGKKPWSPADLPPVPAERKDIKRCDAVAGIIFTVLFLVVCTVQTDALGIYFLSGEQRGIVPFFEQSVIQSFLPLIWLLALLAIGRDSLKLIKRTWTWQLAVVHLLVNAAALGLFALMLQDGAVWNAHFLEGLVQYGMVTPGSDGYASAESTWQLVTSRFFLFLVIIVLVDTITVLYKAWRPAPPVKQRQA
ncbi:hypothetical protein J31TS4_03840 [Paenibacillus sp. J31TS4]|uniref:permease prefix domain 1-containing protein n=1 Tax=Paenibacillus sp. J31TS4 TaxID=2807195 RepID=UPI001B099F3B|nr:permease prefix domain 1-containing protein [Paenibacillus sp. J31TS4]GIP37104.1 hypothetical protein J31TS4_03840 [Paenibacillus sp. J31TS4]